jgi:hypothetical protein
MKFATASSANGRGQMRERQRRDRLVTPTLRVAYPQFSSLRLVFDFKDAGPFTPAPQVAVLHPPARAYFVFPCPYADCDGEFDLTGTIAEMVGEQQASRKGHLNCGGHRNRDEKGRSPCQLTLTYAIEAYRE